MFRRKTQPGFSLIEIMVVLLVISLLASLLLALGRRIHRQAQEKLAKSQIQVIVTAIEQYHSSHEKFPTYIATQEDLKTLLANYHSVTPADIQIFGMDVGYSNCEALFFILDNYPESKRFIDSISPDLLTSRDPGGSQRGYILDNETKSLVRFIDPWGRKLIYERYKDLDGDGDLEELNFPVVFSVGLDGIPGTNDDISSKGI